MMWVGPDKHAGEAVWVPRDWTGYQGRGEMADSEKGKHMSHVLHLGDCLEGLASLPDKSVDHVICDPPYSKIVVTSAKRPQARSAKAREEKGIRQLAVTRSLGYVGIDIAQRSDVAFHIGRITRRWALVFCDAESMSDWARALARGGMRHVRIGAWVSPACTPQFTGDRPGTGWEACEIAHANGKSRWNGGGRPAVWIINRPLNGSQERETAAHPTPKPLELMEQIVSDFTDPGELVCDPFAGSGTTGVACKRLGRNFIGWEKDPAFHAAAVRRIDAAREQFQLPRLAKPKQLPLRGPGKDEEVA